MLQTGTINEISLDPKSWQDKFFLTFDIDWAHDKVLGELLEILAQYPSIKVTFFATHDTPLLNDIKSNPNYECGVHPNFNFLLAGDFRYGDNTEKVLEYYQAFAPDATSVRSHSVTQNSYITDLFARKGFTHDNNHFIPKSSGIELQPWLHWHPSLLKVPYHWEDDLHCAYSWTYTAQDVVNTKGLNVIDLHPVHVILNTDNLQRWDKAKKYNNDYDQFKQFINPGRGMKNFLLELLEILDSGEKITGP